MRTRLSIVAVVLALATACADRAADDIGLPPVPPTAESTTTLAPATTTTTTPARADVADLAATTTMTERARRVFLAAEPAIEDPATFARNCAIEEADVPGQPRTHSQGCYFRGRIHLLARDRPAARERMYVVAAHELLHAVYAELRPAERARIDAELEAARAGNARLEERLLPYASSPTLLNEIHSILGTEFAGLSPALEAHYAQFFADRAAVVAVHQRTLGARDEEIRRLKAELDDLDARITTLKADQESLRASGDFRSYNAYVGVVNGLVDRYNASLQTLNALIEEYNTVVGG